MPTIHEHLAGVLVEHGLWPEEAEAVVTSLESQKDMESMRGRWNESTSAYPIPMHRVLEAHAKTAALAWIKANAPEHFAQNLLKA